MKRILLLSLFLCLGGAIYIFAQKRNFIIYKDTITGKDTIVAKVSFANERDRKKQYAISTIDKDGNTIHTYQAKDIKAYKEGSTLFVSQRIWVDGDIRQVLLPRVYWKKDIFIYSFIPDKGRKEYYVQMQKDSLLLPLKGNSETNGVNPLATYLEQFPVAQEDVVKKYVCNMKPTPASFNSRYRVCRTGNANYIPKIRWGVLAGAGIAELSYSIYDFGKKFQGFVGVFADFPIIDGLSFHPELIYREYSQTKDFLESTTQNKGCAIYNRCDAVMPLMLRYTIISLKGKILPYIQLGVELEMAFKKEAASQYMNTDADGFINWVESGPIPQDNFEVAYTAGIGVEWKLLPTHSLFFDLRYSKEDTYTKQTGYYAVLSFNF